MSDESHGLYGKYVVKRADGSSEPGQKHDGCTYFVLDLEHDPFVRLALRAYARACAKKYPELARDLRRVAATKPRPPCGCREAACPHDMFRLPETPSEMASDLMEKNGKP